MAQWSIQSVFSHLSLTKLSLSSSASNEEPLETAEKTSKLPAIEQQKIKEHNNAWMTDFPWHRHEDDVDTGKSGISAWPYCRPCCARVQTGVGNRNFILGSEQDETWPVLWGWWGGGSSGNLGTLLLLVLGNVDCTSWLRVVTRFFFYCWCHIPIVPAV